MSLRHASTEVLSVGLVALLTAAVAATEIPRTTDPETHPNVLVVNLDDATELMLEWRKPDGTWVMPAVQAFRARSTVYPNTFVDIPSCCPSRFSLFTGRYPHNTGGKLQSDGDLPVRQTFADRLERTSGYATVMAGKFLNAWPLTRRPATFDRFSMIKTGYNDPVINRNGEVGSVAGYSTTLLADDLRGYLTELETDRDDKPWYAYWAPQAPHIAGGWKTLATPETQYADVDMGVCAQPVEADRWDKPPHVRNTPIDREYNQALCVSQLRTMITVDERFAELIVQLEADGELDRTMVVLTSDNGYHWGEQGWFSKFYPYDASIGIPLYVKWPAALGIAPGVDDRLALSLDITVSIFEVTHTEPGKPLDGKSLLGTPARQEVLVEYFVDPVNGAGLPTWSLLRGTGWKYVVDRYDDENGTSQFKEYYDLTADPGELTNVLHDDVTGNEPSESVLRALAKRLRAAQTCAGASCP